MQGSREWKPPSGTLGTILEATRQRLPSLDGGAEAVASRPRAASSRPSFRAALTGDAVAIIAEVKRRSPSKGPLNEALNAGDQAAAFERGGAAAISVLTEPAFFGGSIADLDEVAGRVRVPILKKDFHIDAAQIREAGRSGAAAVLLIARALSPAELPRLLQCAREADLEPIVEVRSIDELDRALDAGAEIVGVNSRDLETLDVDPKVPERLVPRVPRNVMAIWESGVAGVRDVQRAAECGADAVLVGSALSRAADPEKLVRSLTRVPRVRRG